MDGLVALHGIMARAVLLYYLLIGLWGVALGLRGRGLSSAYTGALIVAEIAALAQGVAGLLNLIGHRPQNPLHWLYGVALAVALPLAFTYTRGRAPNRVALFMGVTALFAAGLAIRGVTTG